MALQEPWSPGIALPLRANSSSAVFKLLRFSCEMTWRLWGASHSRGADWAPRLFCVFVAVLGGVAHNQIA
jgi:hypothetical protein